VLKAFYVKAGINISSCRGVISKTLCFKLVTVSKALCFKLMTVLKAFYVKAESYCTPAGDCIKGPLL
jgi:hypothetical protein